MIKTKIAFFVFLLLGVAGFLAMTASLEIDIVQKYEAYFDSNKIVINEDLNGIDSLYVYKSLNEKVHYFHTAKSQIENKL
jgi:hypothetical protein